MNSSMVSCEIKYYRCNISFEDADGEVQVELHGVFADLEKADDRVLTEQLCFCMRKSGVAEEHQSGPGHV